VVAHPVRATVDADNFSVVQETIQHSCCQHIVFKECTPIVKRKVAGKNEGSSFGFYPDLVDTLNRQFFRGQISLILNGRGLQLHSQRQKLRLLEVRTNLRVVQDQLLS
jgi:hypothetical protein